MHALPSRMIEINAAAMVVGVARSALLLGLSLTTGCLPQPGFSCGSDDECAAAANGRCEQDNWCSYPDQECSSRRSYGNSAPPGVAGICVLPGSSSTSATEPAGTSLDTGTTGGESTEASSGDQPPVLCGNGTLDPGETCDDGNRFPDDGCHPLCVEPGTPTWTATYDGEAFGNDRGFGLTVELETSAVYVTGITTASDPDSDILLQRRNLETGDVVWTQAIDGGSDGDDFGEHCTIHTDGNVVVVGRIETARGDTDGWIGKFDPSGNLLWQGTQGGAKGDDGIDGIATEGSGRLVAVGFLTASGGTQAWIQHYDGDGAVDGPAVLRGDQPNANRALDVVATPTGFQVTGNLGVDPGTQNIWTASYTTAGDVLWEDLITAPDVGNETRGVGQDVDPLGGSAVAGVLFNDIVLQRYADDGTQTSRIQVAGGREAHDEAADVAFLADGSFILVGFVDFATVGFATGDIWVRRYSASGEELWTDTIDGEAEEIDKALAVELAGNMSAVVTGYVTVPGQSRDLWIRRYAL